MDSLSTLTAATSAPQSQIGIREFLSFRLGQEEYGADILKVQEIRGYEQPTRMAGVPDFIKGVINLRGIIVPIIDLRIKFNLGEATYDSFTVVIILNVAERVVGIVVDGVSDVISLTSEQIKPAPELTAGGEAGHVIGLGTLDERMVILIDIEQLIAADGLNLASLSLQ